MSRGRRTSRSAPRPTGPPRSSSRAARRRGPSRSRTSGGRGLAVVAAPGVPFGADLETVEPRSPAFMEDFFLASERAWVGSHPESARAAAATLVWSVKESVLKALRTGLREDTRAVETLPGGALFLPRSTATWRPVGALVRRSGLVFEGLATEREGQILTLVRLRSEGT
jgi:hypothetical protein